MGGYSKDPENRKYYFGHPDGGRIDINGVEWFKTDGYVGWYRWEDGELITRVQGIEFND